MCGLPSLRSRTASHWTWDETPGQMPPRIRLHPCSRFQFAHTVHRPTLTLLPFYWPHNKKTMHTQQTPDCTCVLSHLKRFRHRKETNTLRHIFCPRKNPAEIHRHDPHISTVLYRLMSKTHWRKTIKSCCLKLPPFPPVGSASNHIPYIRKIHHIASLPASPKKGLVFPPNASQFPVPFCSLLILSHPNLPVAFR